MAQLARLVGRAALKAKSGDREAAEVVRSALRESDRTAFKEQDRDTLRTVLDELTERLNSRERMAAKTLLLRPDGIREWFALTSSQALGGTSGHFGRRYTVRRGHLHGRMSVSMGLGVLYIGYKSKFNNDGGNSRFDRHLSLGRSGVWNYSFLCHYSGSNALGSAGIRCGNCRIVTAGVGAIVLEILSTDIVGMAWITAEMQRYAPPSLSWLVFLAFAAPSFAVVRWLMGISPRRITALKSALPAMGWPIFAATGAALAAQWGSADLARAASFGWAAFVISGVAFSVTAAKVEIRVVRNA